MQIVIPMSGFGERFRRAGYTVPKPLIEIEGKPVIAHVVDMFPEEADIIFICNEDHLQSKDFRMSDTIKSYCPDARIMSIASHKLGPVYAVSQIYDHLDQDMPTVVNYCDFTCYWDWHHFKQTVSTLGCEGAIPAYKGFHPHTLGNTNYAYMREQNHRLLDIQEKKPYTENRMNEYASSGTYYFSSTRLMKESFDFIIEKAMTVGDEYYVSMAYKYLLKQQLQTLIYPLQHFMQRGTPEDVKEYNIWSGVFRSYVDAEADTEKADLEHESILPMGGLGQRFFDEGYSVTKPLIKVSGLPMAVQAAKDLPNSKNMTFILRKDMPELSQANISLKEAFIKPTIIQLDGLTQGQACTAMEGISALLHRDEPYSGPITIGACDNGIIFNKNKFKDLLFDSNIDAIVWGVRGHVNAIRKPEMYSWIEEEDGRVKKISVKTPLSSPAEDSIVIGAFTFSNPLLFKIAFDDMLANKGLVNGEYYIDSCINSLINMGKKCVLFEVDYYIGWGTPNELKTFEYWQSCFHKWQSHPYDLNNDNRIPNNEVPYLMEAYKKIVPDLEND